MTATHLRKSGKSAVKRVFNLALNGVLISSILLGSITFTGCNTVNGEEASNLVTQVNQQIKLQEESTYVANLKLAIKAINETITSNKWTSTSFDSLCKALINIEVKLNIDGFKSNSDLADLIKKADKAVKGIDVISISLIPDLKSKHTVAVDTIARIKSKIGIQSEESSKPKIEDEISITSAKDDDKQNQSNSIEKHATAEDEGIVSNNVGKPSTSTSTHIQSINTNRVTPLAITEKIENPKPSTVNPVESINSEVPDKYKGYNKTTARLKTVNSDATIFTKYGTHTYGCSTQEQYNKVLSKVEDAVKNIDSLVWTERQQWLYNQTLKGVKYKDFPGNSEEYLTLKAYQGTWGFATFKLKPEDSKKLIKGGLLFDYLSINAKDPGDGSPNSAYSVLFNNQGDCDGYAMLEIAIRDVQGYSSRMIQTSPTHATAHVRIENIWWGEGGTPVNSNPSSSSIVVTPTF
jgi:hypothetical protein